MSDVQRELARHALGLPNKQNMSYRNHFCIGKGSDGYNDWEDLVSKGLAVKAIGGSEWSGDFFYLTLEGALMAREPREHISREDAQKMRRMVMERSTPENDKVTEPQPTPEAKA